MAHQRIWRIGCCSSSSPKRSASSTAARCSGSAGKSGGSGRRRSSSRAIWREPCTLLPSIFRAGTVGAGEADRAQRELGDHRQQVGALVGDALVLEHQPRGDRRVRGGDDVEARASTRRSYGDNRSVLLAVDVGNTQTHLGAFEGEELIEHWRFQTRSGATGDELAERIAGFFSLCGMTFRRRRRRSASPRWCRRSAASSSELTRALPRGRVPDDRPGVKTGMPIRIDNPLEVGADRLVNAIAAYERFGEACVVGRLRHRHQHRRRLRRRRVPRRRDRPRPRALDSAP